MSDYWKETGVTTPDKGRADVTKNDADLYVFKVASLRNVTQTAPYFHDGSVDDLTKAVKIMGKTQLGQDLSDKDAADIVAFLGALTGSGSAELFCAGALSGRRDEIGARPSPARGREVALQSRAG